MKHYFLLLLLSCIYCACSDVPLGKSNDMHYARWLQLEERDQMTLATVLNPWAEGTVLHRYILAEKGVTIPDSMEGTIVRVPLQHAVSSTSPHAYLAYRLDALRQLAGVMDKRFIVSPELREAGLRDFGSSQAPNLEAMLLAGCDAIFVSPMDGGKYGALESLNLPLIECADYMEQTPLGRAEWMRFYGRLFGKAQEADSLFAAEKRDYMTLCNLKTEHRPKVMVDTQWGEGWYVPGGQSFLAQVFRDAQCDYFYAADEHCGSVSLSYEKVLMASHDADLWLLRTMTDVTYQTLKQEHPRYTAFRPFKEHHIWACNTLTHPYYDILPFFPSLLLKDILLIAHPECFPHEKPVYFEPVELGSIN